MAFGLRPLRYRNGTPYNGAVSRYYKSASVILGIGDPVVLAGSAHTDGTPTIDRAAAGSGTITGVFAGIDPIPSDLTKKGFAAADVGYCYVIDDPNVLFVIEEDGDTTPIPATAVGEFCDLATVGNANSTIWQSTVQLDSSNAATGDNVRIIELLHRPDNAIMATTASVKGLWVVSINEHTFKAVETPI